MQKTGFGRDLDLRLETAEVVARMEGFLGRPFTDKECSLGLLSFLVWFAQAEELRRARHPYFEKYVGAVNDSARAAGIEFVTDGLATSGVVEAVTQHFPRFNPTVEARLAIETVRPGGPGHDIWHDSLTRVMILTTRALAYAFCEGRLQAIRSALGEDLNSTIGLAETQIAGWLTPAPARLLRNRTMATVQAVESASSPPARGQSDGSGSGCFARGTAVHVPGGARPIEELHVGDRVVAFNPSSGEPCTRHIRGVRRVDDALVVRLITTLATLDCTPDHHLEGSRGRVAVGSLRPGDLLRAISGPATVISIQRLHERSSAFNLYVEDVSTFLPAGLIAHSHARLGPLRAMLEHTRYATEQRGSAIWGLLPAWG